LMHSIRAFLLVVKGVVITHDLVSKTVKICIETCMVRIGP